MSRILSLQASEVRSPRNQSDPEGELVDVDHHYPSFGISRRAAPIDAPDVTRKDHGPFQGGRCEDALVSERSHLIVARLAFSLVGSPGIIRGKVLWVKRRRQHREGLRLRGFFTGDIAHGNTTLFDWK